MRMDDCLKWAYVLCIMPAVETHAVETHAVETHVKLPGSAKQREARDGAPTQLILSPRAVAGCTVYGVS